LEVVVNDKEYEYSAGIQFICEYMTVYHNAYLITNEYFDLDEAEVLIIDHADEFLNDYYGFSIKKLATVDIEILWDSYPENEENS
jgi:hypothetical protein